jgi:TetR/AcrR family transcriptional regulator, cholesterol catabolism regulator
LTTNAEIVQAATKIFREKGYHGTSMQDIADAVGLLKGSLYHHISSKQELLNVICSTSIEVAIEPLENIAASNLPPEAKLEQALRNHVRIITQHVDEAIVFLREEHHLSPESRRAISADRDRFEKMLGRIIQEGVDGGQFRALDVPIITKAILGITNWIVQWYTAHGRLNGDDIAAIMADFILNGLAAGEATAPASTTTAAARPRSL